MEPLLHLFDNEADDVNLSPDQARDVFKLLGLDLTEAQIKQLDDVPLDEFMRTLEAQTATTTIEVSEVEPKEEATISYNQLHEFLRSCNLDVPQESILEFLAQQSNSTITEADPLVFDKEGFARFLEQLTPSPSASPAPSPAKPINPRATQKKSKSKARRRHRAP
ncbi:hypothetical protein SPRG_08330 [Saprolegnia parasitica CBS 223.65]|uniref:EF-hand domain-containing protein n=1 Tax=Saprolegnia parasitica (strain CBS 223.65) TaxID=695850 RepID=A0A067C677_SAPPC|nr:hypothetical protein SPRG_08330 [Saprolegnia parasitica CBS 223.65]KDO26254.1 hypothetical protein SPRG_08330 [Saprolegnia parasitica CBS 223.65]|eukprot:XP_012202963.1 hypothetical protein SPRG_08330 [Saprolegnia parasitica CBS 223.65]